MLETLFRAGTQFFFAQQSYFVERQCPEGAWLVRNERTLRAVKASEQQLRSALMDGRLTVKTVRNTK